MVQGVVGWGEDVLYLMSAEGTQLILAYCWARPTVLAAGKGRGGIYLFLLFCHFLSFSSSSPIPLSSPLLSLLSLFFFSGRWHKMSTTVDVSLNPSTIGGCGGEISQSLLSEGLQNYTFQGSPQWIHLNLGQVDIITIWRKGWLNIEFMTDMWED